MLICVFFLNLISGYHISNAELYIAGIAKIMILGCNLTTAVDCNAAELTTES